MAHCPNIAERATARSIVTAFALAAVILVPTQAAAHSVTTPYCEATGPYLLCLNEQDFSPSETVHLSGGGFAPGGAYTIRVTRPDTSVVTGDGSFDPWPAPYDTVIADGAGEFQFDYVLDGIFGAYLVEVLDGPWNGALSTVLATTSFTDAQVDLDHAKNGSATSPNSPVVFEDGNAGQNNSHYVEGYSIPYRVVMTDLPPSTSVTLTIEYDIVHSDANAIDYLTHYQRLDPHTPFLHLGGNGPGVAETVDPTVGGSACTAGSTNICAAANISGPPHGTFPIPAPAGINSPVPGQPATSFLALPPSERVMSIWNGTITDVAYVSQGDLSALATGAPTQASTQVAITFTTDPVETVTLLAWGGHIGASVDWAPSLTAVDINGSPYHTRLISWTLGNIGQQDHQLSADAVIAPCENVDCDDGVACTLDSCDPGTGQCVNTASDALCGDGLFCNGVETCDPVGGCQAGTPVSCDDGVSCTVDACNEATDQCDHGPDDASCSDGLFCNGVETCDPVGGCQAGTPVSCGDGIACTVDSCNELADQCDHVAVDVACSNGQFCDGVEICNPLAGCQAGPPVDCDDGVSCTADSCNEATDQCVNAPNHAVCSNGQFCDGSEVCDPLAGCQPGTPVDCQDGVSCTTDACDEIGDQCDHTPSDAACDDGQFCNGTETCDSVNDCQPGIDPCLPFGCNEPGDFCLACLNDLDCDDGAFCNGAETCDVNSGTCQPGTPVSCDDGVTCTTDACNEALDQCVNTPNDAVCSNGVFCDGAEVCDLVNDCVAGPAVDCDDGVACTVDSCNEATNQCDSSPNDGVCANGLFCDGVEICDPLAGCIPGPTVDCGDGVGCTVDSCNETTDQCDHAANAALCDNGAFCDGIESCDLLADCQAGLPVDCADVVACTIDSCNEATDSCIHAPDDALCSNGQFCDGNEICDPLGCLPGTPVSCDDSDACTADTCDDTIDQCVYSDVCCGNGVLDPGEECEPPNDEDCNNGVDDDGDGREDCRDVDSCADPQNPTVGIETCGDDCTLDMPCTRIRRDPAIIKFGLDGRPDRLTIHGRFPLSSTVEPFAEHFSYSLANDEGVIYRGVLIPGDLRGSAKRLKFKDRTARHGVGSRDGLSIVRLKLLTVGGEPYLSFLVKAYGDLSAATLPLMASQIVVGNDSGYLERAWSPTKSGWKLNDRDF